MATHLKKGKPETLYDLTERAKTYLEAHSSDILFGIDPKSSRSQGSRSPPPKRCHNCGSPDHLRNQCPKPQTPTSPKHPRAPQPPFPPRPVPFQRQPSYGGFKPTSPPREPPRCYVCNKVGHIARGCRLKSTSAMEHQGYYRYPPQQEYFRQQNLPQYHNYPQVSEPDVMREPVQNRGPPAPSGPAKTTIASPTKPRSPPPPEFRPPALTQAPIQDVCWKHNAVRCEKCLNIPTTTHHCQALIAICQDCGQQHPVVADACLAHCKDTNMPVTDGLLEEQPVQVLRDTGCSAVIVRGSLVSEARCVLIDGTIVEPQLLKSS